MCMHAEDRSDSADPGSSAVWSALDDALLMFPLTKPVRLALLNLLCSQQVSLQYPHSVMSLEPQYQESQCHESQCYEA